MLLLAASSNVALAGNPPPWAPEIDPGSTLSAFTLLVTGTFMLGDRIRKK